MKKIFVPGGVGGWGGVEKQIIHIHAPGRGTPGVEILNHFTCFSMQSDQIHEEQTRGSETNVRSG